jgi:hypothetical protein
MYIQLIIIQYILLDFAHSGHFSAKSEKIRNLRKQQIKK